LLTSTYAAASRRDVAATVAAAADLFLRGAAPKKTRGKA
jgi:hypothetical protein